MILLTDEERKDVVTKTTNNIPIPRTPHIEKAIAKAQAEKTMNQVEYAFTINPTATKFIISCGVWQQLRKEIENYDKE